MQIMQCAKLVWEREGHHTWLIVLYATPSSVCWFVAGLALVDTTTGVFSFVVNTGDVSGPFVMSYFNWIC